MSNSLRLMIFLLIFPNFSYARGNGDGFGFALFALVGVFFLLWYLGKFLKNSADASERMFAGFFVFIAIVTVFGLLKKHL